MGVYSHQVLEKESLGWYVCFIIVGIVSGLLLRCCPIQCFTKRTESNWCNLNKNKKHYDSRFVVCSNTKSISILGLKCDVVYYKS